MKPTLLTLLFIPAIVAAQAGTIHGKAFQNPSGDIASVDGCSKIPLDSIPPDDTGMRNLTSFQISKEMVPGWNVGNSLEAIGGETAWGNPLITQTLIDSVQAAGFKSVRIPVAWSNGMNASTYEISPALMARVEQVVNYVLNDGMYAVINIHWDGGWMQPTYAKQDYVNTRLAALWRQIAVYFRDYDDHLLFAGTNEVMVEGNYGTPTKEYYTVQNGFNQTFVTTVRSTGGCNAYRHLVVQGFNTNINYTVSYFAAPKDAVANKLTVEVHYYDPYDFTLNTNSSITQWGKYATDPSKTETWANEPYVDAQFQKMKAKFIDGGYAVLLGEYGAIARLNLGSNALNAEHAEFRRYYIEYVTGSMVRHGLVPVIWDNGFTGDKSMGLFNRHTGAQAYRTIIKTIMDVVDTTHFNSDVGMPRPFPPPARFTLHPNYPNPWNPSTVISFTIERTSDVILKVYNSLGQEVRMLVDKKLDPGNYAVTLEGQGLPSGIYFYRLQAGSYAETQKCVLLK
jgi:endoglucanase